MNLDSQFYLLPLFWLISFTQIIYPFNQSYAASIIKIDGSSTVFPITEAVAEEFQIDQKGKVQITVGISGTGGGFKKFCRGEIDVQNASRSIAKEEMESCESNGVRYLEFPIAYDAMVIVVHPKNDWLNEITTDELKKIWAPESQDKIKTWNQVNAKWPSLPLKLYGAGPDSGTFDYFTEAIVGKVRASRGDYTASEDDNTLVQGISSDKNSLGYIPFAYYELNKNKLKVLAVKSPNKAPVLPSLQSVNEGTYFPLSRPIFIYLAEKSLLRPEIRSFTEFYLKNSKELVTQVKYVPLPEMAYTLALENLKKGKLGSAFDGQAQIGLKIEDLLKREVRN